MNLLTAVVFVLALSIKDSFGELKNGKIKISVITTSGCTDSVRFIRDQLIPTYELYGEHLDVEFIPWGRTVRNQNGAMTCQFGPADCWANRVHRCALNLLGDDQKAQIDYMGCEFADFTNRPAFLEGSYICGFLSNINMNQLDRCTNTFYGDPLDAASEQASTVPMQIINFVPAVYINDSPDSVQWMNIFLNLRQIICSMLVEDPSSGVTSCAL